MHAVLFSIHSQFTKHTQTSVVNRLQANREREMVQLAHKLKLNHPPPEQNGGYSILSIFHSIRCGSDSEFQAHKLRTNRMYSSNNNGVVCTELFKFYHDIDIRSIRCERRISGGGRARSEDVKMQSSVLCTLHGIGIWFREKHF